MCKECIIYTKHATLRYICNTCDVNIFQFNYRGLAIILDMLCQKCIEAYNNRRKFIFIDILVDMSEYNS